VNLVPWPNSVQVADGRLAIAPDARIVAGDPALKPQAQVLADEIKRAFNVELAVADGDAKAGDLVLQKGSDLKDEQYRLTVTDRVEVAGADSHAVSLGTATLLQAFSLSDKAELSLPKMTITDQPAFGYRGLMIDVARKPHTIESLEQLVELCRVYKIRYLQLHLSDNEGFTFESKIFPKLGSKNWNKIPVYTQEQLRDLVAFADARGVTIVPEIETPGHAGAMVRSDPEAFKLMMGRDEVFPALDKLLGEIADVFASSPYIHIGCDEVSLGDMAKSPEVKQYIKDKGLNGPGELYPYFIVQMNEIVKKHGKKAILWEGFGGEGSAHAKIPKDMTVMVFESRYNPAENLVKHGYPVINAAWTPLYITQGVRTTVQHIYDWNIDTLGEFPGGGYDKVRWHKVPSTDLVQGAQMCAWEQQDEIELPSLRRRVAAMSERIWNPAAKRTWEDFSTRLEATNGLVSNLLLPLTIHADGLVEKDGSSMDKSIFQHNVFDKALTVTLTPTRPLRDGETIRYTLNSDAPKADSTAYTKPLTLTKADTKDLYVPNFPNAHRVTLQAAIFNGDKQVQGHLTQQYNYDYTQDLPQKLSFRMYTLPEDMMQVPENGGDLKPTTTGTTPWVNLRGMPSLIRSGTSAIFWDGTIQIDKEGKYTAMLRTQGGTGKLFIDDKQIIDRDKSDWGNNEAPITLTAGPHTLRVLYQGAGDFITLTLTPDGAKEKVGIDKYLVPLKEEKKTE
jgi:hexosaminidase